MERGVSAVSSTVFSSSALTKKYAFSFVSDDRVDVSVAPFTPFYPFAGELVS